MKKCESCGGLAEFAYEDLWLCVDCYEETMTAQLAKKQIRARRRIENRLLGRRMW